MNLPSPTYIVSDFEVKISRLRAIPESESLLVLSFGWHPPEGVSSNAWSTDQAGLDLSERGLLLTSGGSAPALLFPLSSNDEDIESVDRDIFLAELARRRSLMVCAFDTDHQAVLALEFNF